MFSAQVRAFVGAVVIESGEINVSNVPLSRRLRGDSLWLVPASSCQSATAALEGAGGCPNESIRVLEDGCLIDKSSVTQARSALLVILFGAWAGLRLALIPCR